MPTIKDFARWMRDLSNQEASDVLGVSLTTVNNHKRKKGSIPSVVAIACSALAEDKTALYTHYRPRRTDVPARRPAADALATTPPHLPSPIRLKGAQKSGWAKE